MLQDTRQLPIDSRFLWFVAERVQLVQEEPNFLTYYTEAVFTAFVVFIFRKHIPLSLKCALNIYM